MSCSPSLSCVVHACRSREVTRARRGDVAQANRRDSARYIHRGRCASLEIISRPSARVNRIFRLRFLLFLLPLGASRHLLIVSRVDSSRSTTSDDPRRRAGGDSKGRWPRGTHHFHPVDDASRFPSAC